MVATPEGGEWGEDVKCVCMHACVQMCGGRQWGMHTGIPILLKFSRADALGAVQLLCFPQWNFGI